MIKTCENLIDVLFIERNKKLYCRGYCKKLEREKEVEFGKKAWCRGEFGPCIIWTKDQKEE